MKTGMGAAEGARALGLASLPAEIALGVPYLPSAAAGKRSGGGSLLILLLLRPSKRCRRARARRVPSGRQHLPRRSRTAAKRSLPGGRGDEVHRGKREAEALGTKRPLTAAAWPKEPGNFFPRASKRHPALISGMGRVVRLVVFFPSLLHISLVFISLLQGVISCECL